MVNLEKFLIPLKDIELATEDFQQKNEIAGGEYSKLYRGQLSESWENRTAAFKRFTGYLCDGKKEFLNELKFISNMNHENIIPFIGYCDEGEEMIMVYEYPVNSSLANYLEDPELIPGNQSYQQVYKPHTNGMSSQKDPIYLQTGFLNAESDIYSFGVLLFRILTRPEGFARMSKGGDYMKNNLTLEVQHRYHNRLDSLTDPAIRDQIGYPSFRMIEEITCKCLSFNMKDRPTTDKLVKTIENALDIHGTCLSAPTLSLPLADHSLETGSDRSRMDRTENRLGPKLGLGPELGLRLELG
uniref:Protein kinase, ATP binding site-containing protein n=1 Tax=Tanacetum cinerariifolium TaxID=118510 RepID=A0A699GWC4_TANCI|nr:protein kinase, ATP binding site-containing protein [Tanacetum cinerariifolium]